MSDGEQAVVGVLAVEVVVRPAAKETSAVGPERVNEIETSLRESFERHLQAGQRVERGGGREQIGYGGVRRGQKAAARMTAIEQPHAKVRLDGRVQLPERCDHTGR